MGNSQSSKRAVLDTSSQTEIVVCAFVRDAQRLLPDEAVIPQELAMIIHKYYKAANQCLMLWSGTYKFRGTNQTKHNDIKFVMLDTNHDEKDDDSHSLQPLPFTLNVKDLSNMKNKTSTSSLTRTDTFDVVQCGHSIACNVNLPTWFSQQHDLIATHTNYRMLIRIGGEPSSKGQKCDITLFDAMRVQEQHRYKNALDEQQNAEMEIEAYYARLPDLPVSLGHTSSIYHHDTILTVGGLGDATSNKVFEMKFNTETRKEWKWTECKQINYQKLYGVKLCGIEDEKVLIIGGFEPPRSSDKVILYRVGDDDEISGKKVDQHVPNLCIARYKSGCCYDGQKQRVFVGGGYNTGKPAKNTVEYLDLNKCNKWVQIADRTKETHMFSPIVWIAEDNPNVLYIAGDEVGDHRFNYLRSIERYDLRDNDPWKSWKRFKDFFNEPSSDDWRSRALLAFTV